MSRWFALVGLRYRLAWAHARSRQGRMVLFAVGYLAVVTAALLFALGGFGAAAAAVRVGRASVVAATVLTGVYLNVAFASVFLGIGAHAALSETTLRRYPLSRASRVAVQHVTALLEPLWIVTLTMALGLAVGFPMMGMGSEWFGVPAALLFVIATYLLASLITRLGEWVLSMPGGLLLTIVAGTGLMVAAPLAPAWLAKMSARPGGLPFSAMIELTPPFAAAQAMTAVTSSTAFTGVVLLLAWCGSLAALLTGAYHLPRRSPSTSDAPARWEHPADRVAVLFGPTLAPLAGKMLRYYLRSPQTRYNYPLALPLLGVMIATNADRDPFLFALAVAPALTTLATGTLSLNLFGFDGHGFRRYFLLPVRAVDVLRTAALVSLIPGALLLAIGFVAWLALAPDPVTLRMAGMLLCAGFGGSLFFSALALWTTLLAPRAIPFDLMFGNKLSPAANLLFVLVMVVFFGGYIALAAFGIDSVLKAWWVPPLFLGAAAGFYVSTLRVGARVLVARREQMLATIEGR